MSNKQTDTFNEYYYQRFQDMTTRELGNFLANHKCEEFDCQICVIALKEMDKRKKEEEDTTVETQNWYFDQEREFYKQND